MSIDHKKLKTKFEAGRAKAEQDIDAGKGAQVSKVGRTSGNEKLRATRNLYEKKHGVKAIIGSWNLPAKITCGIGAKDCLTYCYALQGRFLFTSVMGVRFRNLLSIATLDDKHKPTCDKDKAATAMRREFLAWVLSEAKGADVAILRLHDSGDFFSQDYVDAMAEAIELVRKDLANMGVQTELIPYAYTKAHVLNLEPLKRAGVRIVQSSGGKHDATLSLGLPIARVFSKREDMQAPWIDGQNEAYKDVLAIDGHMRIGLTYHGTSKEPETLSRRRDLIQITTRRAGATHMFFSTVGGVK